MKVEANGHEWELGQPCKHCGKTKGEIFASPDETCPKRNAAMIVPEHRTTYQSKG